MAVDKKEMKWGEFASEEEWMFSHYIEELHAHGWIKSYEYQPQSFELCPRVHRHVFVKRPKSVNPEYLIMVRPHVYTPDWRIIWSEDADGIFTWSPGKTYWPKFREHNENRWEEYLPFMCENLESFIDVKAPFLTRTKSSDITFPLNQKWVLDKHGKYVQKCVVSVRKEGIFHRTFSPEYLINNLVYRASGTNHVVGDSKLKNITVRTLEEFLNVKHGYKKKESKKYF